MENGPFEDVFPIINMRIFHCYVSLPEGNQQDFDRIFLVHFASLEQEVKPENPSAWDESLKKILP